MRGDFVLLIWDYQRCEGLLARDQLGVRSMFLHDASDSLCFASEVRYLLALLPRRPAPDPVSLAHWLTMSNRPGSATLFAGIRRLTPARCYCSIATACARALLGASLHRAAGRSRTRSRPADPRGARSCRGAADWRGRPHRRIDERGFGLLIGGRHGRDAGAGPGIGLRSRVPRSSRSRRVHSDRRAGQPWTFRALRPKCGPAAYWQAR